MVNYILNINANVPKYYISTSIDADSKTVPFGLKRALEVKEESLQDGKYMYCKVGGNWQFIDKDSIISYEKDTEEKVFTKTYTAETFKYSKNKLYFKQDNSVVEIEEIVYNTSYNFPTIKKEESYNKDNSILNSFETNGKGFIDKAIKTDKYYTEQESVKKSSEIGEENLIKFKNYTLGKNGNFIKINLKNQQYETIVNLSNLYIDSGCTTRVDISKLTNYTGQKLYTKINDNIIETEPLTYQQATLKFNKNEILEEYVDISQKTDDNEPLFKLKNGKMISVEKAIQPVGYDIVDPASSSFTHYLFEYKEGDTEKSVVITKEEINKKKKPLKITDSVDFNIRKAKKLIRSTKELKECDVLRTTDFNSGVAISKKNSDHKKEIADNAINETKAAYADNQFTPTEVVIDGKVVELDPRLKKYIQTDTFYKTDYAEIGHECDFIKGSSVQYKDGKFVGGPKFDFKKSMLKDMKKWGKGWINGVILVCNPIGLAVGLIAPQLIVGAAALWAGYGVYLMGKNIVKNISINHRKQNYNNNIEANNKVEKRAIELSYQHLLNSTKDNINNLSVESFNTEINKIEQRIISLSSAKYLAKYKIGDTITSQNAHLYSQCLKEFKKDKKELKKLKKSLTEAEYKERVDAFNAKYANYEKEGIISSKDKDMDTMLKKVENVKTFMYLKYFMLKGNKQEVVDLLAGQEFVGDEKTIISTRASILENIQKLDYDFKNGCFTKNGKKVDETINKDLMQLIENEKVVATVGKQLAKAKESSLKLVAHKEEENPEAVTQKARKTELSMQKKLERQAKKEMLDNFDIEYNKSLKISTTENNVEKLISIMKESDELAKKSRLGTKDQKRFDSLYDLLKTINKQINNINKSIDDLDLEEKIRRDFKTYRTQLISSLRNHGKIVTDSFVIEES